MKVIFLSSLLILLSTSASAQSEDPKDYAKKHGFKPSQFAPNVKLPPLSMCMTDDGIARLLREHPDAKVTHTSQPPRALFYGEQIRQVYPLNQYPETKDQVVVGFTCYSSYSTASNWLRCLQFGQICNGNLRFDPYDDSVPGIPSITWSSFDIRASSRYPTSGSFGRVDWYTVKGNPYPLSADQAHPQASAPSR